MSTYRNTFDREWITVGEHRILVHQRDGAPGVLVRRAAMIAAWTVENNQPDSASVRVVEAFHDCSKSYQIQITLGTDKIEAFDPSEPIVLALESVFDGIDASVRLVVVEEGRTHSDHYDYTEHVIRSVMKSRNQEAYLA